MNTICLATLDRSAPMVGSMVMARSRCMFAVGIATLFACGPGAPVETSGVTEAESDGTGASTTTGSSDTILDTTQPTTNMTAGEGDPLATCECVIINEADGNYIDTELCGGGGCGEIELGCDDQPVQGDPFCVDGGVPVLDITAVDCAIDQLIEGTAGYLSYLETPDGNYAYVGGVLKIGEGRLGLTMNFWGEDQDFHRSAHEVVPLRDAEYFLGCKTLTDPQKRYACLKDWTGGPAIDACDAPYPRD